MQKSQIDIGMEIEKEHLSTYEMFKKYAEHFYRTKIEVGVNFPTFEQFAMHIVLEHLHEDIFYYTKLEAMEKNTMIGSKGIKRQGGVIQ